MTDPKEPGPMPVDVPTQKSKKVQGRAAPKTLARQWQDIDAAALSFVQSWRQQQRHQETPQLIANQEVADRYAAQRDAYLATQPVAPFGTGPVDSTVAALADDNTLNLSRQSSGAFAADGADALAVDDDGDDKDDDSGVSDDNNDRGDQSADDHYNHGNLAHSRPSSSQAQSDWAGPRQRVQIHRDGDNAPTSLYPAAVGMPQVKVCPQYKAWALLVENEKAVATGYPMFYTDELGETVPASDSDNEYNDFNRNRKNAAIEGPDRTKHEALLLHLVENFQDRLSDVWEYLQDKWAVDGKFLEDRLKRLRTPKHHAAWILRQQRNVDHCLALFSLRFCRRCRVYGCLKHEGDQQRPHSTSAPLQQVDGDSQPCGLKCWKHKKDSQAHGVAAAGVEAELEFSELESTVIERYHRLFGGNCCRLAQFLCTRSCLEVWQWCSKRAFNNMAESEDGNECGDHKGQHKRKRTGSKGAKQVATKRRAIKAKLWPEYEPCDCPGPCTTNCPCNDNKHFCEKYCACVGKCMSVVVGCNCHGREQCRTTACACFRQQRECDPDICKGCTSTCTADGTFRNECNNMRLRLRQHKRVAVGISNIQGWGAFLLEPARKGDYIGEYTGELLSHAEAERRGKCYDRDNNSYLFDLNEQWVIDARERGNKLRFANHSEDPNCLAQIIMVDGDHRVAIFACKDIAPGTELFYDYRYTDDTAPQWVKAYWANQKASASADGRHSEEPARSLGATAKSDKGAGRSRG